MRHATCDFDAVSKALIVPISLKDHPDCSEPLCGLRVQSVARALQNYKFKPTHFLSVTIHTYCIPANFHRLFHI